LSLSLTANPHFNDGLAGSLFSRFQRRRLTPLRCPSTGTIHEILTREAYTGVRRLNEFNRKGDGERKDTSEIVEYEIPAIIDRAIFDEVQALMTQSGPALLENAQPRGLGVVATSGREKLNSSNPPAYPGVRPLAAAISKSENTA